MILTALALAATLAGSPAGNATQADAHKHRPITQVHTDSHARQNLLAVDLHPMTDYEKHFYPGRENWDKTEWYEAQYKTAKIVIVPEHVDEWHNGGLDVS